MEHRWQQQRQQQRQTHNMRAASCQLPVWPQCHPHPQPKTVTKARDKINKKILFELLPLLLLLLRRRHLSWKPNKSHNNKKKKKKNKNNVRNSISPSSKWLPPLAASTAPAAYVPLQKLTRRTSLQIAVNVVIGIRCGPTDTIDSICSERSFSLSLSACT